MRHKKCAEVSIGVDIDERVIGEWKDMRRPDLRLFARDAIDFLQDYRFDGGEFIFCDPPYHPSTRRRDRVYRFEYSATDHKSLLDVLRNLPCKAMVVGYPCQLYAERLSDWRRTELVGTSHVGRRRELAWMNYRVSDLHDYRYLGASFSDRQRIRRKQERWLAKLAEMPALERRALVAKIWKRFGADERR